ncbi:MAG: glycoside hydrolase family 97 protein [Hyphomonadaceae bacterium]
MLRFLITCLCLVWASSALADPSFKATSPDGKIMVEVGSSFGEATYQISRAGKPVITRSKMGFLFTNAPKFDRSLSAISHTTRSFDETWEQPWGEAKSILNRYNELTVTFQDGRGAPRQFSVTFRVYDDGVGFRYLFPDQPNLKQVAISEELTEFNLADDGTAWWIPAGEWNRYEYLYNRTPLREVGQAHTPMTVRTKSGLHVSFHEAALVDYSSMWLRHTGGTKFISTLSPSSRGAKVVRTAPFSTPWRTIQISDDAAGLVMSHLILNLNEPNALGDVSWVKPSKYVGIWWEMHINKSTWGSGPKHGATTENAKRYIDFAAEHGFRGVLIEGWNTGWDGDWFGGETGFDFTTAYPDFDLKAVTDYAKSKGVHLVGHHETAANIANYEPQMEAAFALYERLGVDSVKTGYVADAGGARYRDANGHIVFEWHDGQEAVRHHLRVVETAARHKIAINAHEPIKDTGLRRTYPNWVSREGARGQEYNAWGNPENPPEHEVNLVFTRMLAGPMDFTPGIFAINPTQKGHRARTTIAKQLALYVTLYSPIQMAADLPEHYLANPRPFQFIKDVPVDWSETRALNGEVGDFVTIARKDRASDNWYLGALTDEHARRLRVPLTFLDAGRTYKAQIYRDGPKADWDKNPLDIVIEEKMVTRDQVLDIRLAPGGGQAIRFVAQ